MNIFQNLMNRRRFLKTSAVAGAAGAAVAGLGGLPGLTPVREARAQSIRGETRITKNVCGQCPARCGIDVYTTDGRVHAIYGTSDHPIANGKGCPKMHLGTYILYDPDRFKGPMKRTNPRKGRNEDPGFVPISWDEAFDTVAARLNALRERGESHRFAMLFGRGWGATDVGLYGPFGRLYGTPNSPLGHSSMCADASMLARQAQEGVNTYHSMDYKNCNYLLIFGASFLEAFRPYNYLMQVWGGMRSKSPKTHVTVVDVRACPTAAAADRALYIKPGTDGALALAIAHVILTEKLWDREFVGDFSDPDTRFRAGQRIDPNLFNQKWVHGLPEWWNEELKDRTPEWAEGVTTIPAATIRTVAREFGTTRPAMVIQERGPGSHTNGSYNCMAANALNALVGATFAVGGTMHQMGAPYGGIPVKLDDYLDDYAKSDDRKVPRIDLVRASGGRPLAKQAMQDIARNHAAGNPYKLDTMLFNMCNPIWTAPDNTSWEEDLKDVFIIGTAPVPDETNIYADLVLPEHTYLERLQVVADQPIHGYPQAHLRTPAIPPLYDTRDFADIIIEIGKRIKGPMGEYYKALGNHEFLVHALAKGFETNPGDNGVTDFESWKAQGVWYRKPYHWVQRRGEFFEWDGQGHNKPMTEEEVKATLLKTPSGKFEFKSGLLEQHAEYINRELGVALNRVGYPQWVPPRYTGAGDLHLVSPKTPMHAEGRSANIPHAIALMQPSAGGRTTVYLEIHPDTARARGIQNGDKVRIKSNLGSIEAYCRYVASNRPDTLVLPMEHGHWAQGRWARGRLPGHSGDITENVSDPISGLASYYTGKVSVERA